MCRFQQASKQAKRSKQLDFVHHLPSYPSPHQVCDTYDKWRRSCNAVHQRMGRSQWLSLLVVIFIIAITNMQQQEGAEASSRFPSSVLSTFNASPMASDNKPTHLCVLAHGYVSGSGSGGAIGMIIYAPDLSRQDDDDDDPPPLIYI